MESLLHPKRRDILVGTLAASLIAASSGRLLAQDGTTKINMALGWVPTVQYAGLWIADARNYLSDAHISPEWAPGGPNAPDPLAQLAADSAQIALGEWLPFLDARAKGNDFVILGAIYQKAPNAIMSLARKPILTPKDLVGAKILAQNPNDKLIINSILGRAGLPLEYEIIPTGFSPDPLMNGDGDAYLSFAINQPIILESMGLKQDKDFFVRLYADLGYSIPGGFLMSKRSFVEKNRAVVVAYLKAFAHGWRDNAKDPAYATDLTVNKYGADLSLDRAQQLRQNELQIPLVMRSGQPDCIWLDQDAVADGLAQAAKGAGRQMPPIADILVLDPLKEAFATL